MVYLCSSDFASTNIEPKRGDDETIETDELVAIPLALAEGLRHRSRLYNTLVYKKVSSECLSASEGPTSRINLRKNARE